MSLAKTVTRFLLITAGVYILLVLPIPGVREAYRDGFLAVGRWLFHPFGPNGLVRFESRTGVSGMDSVITLGKRGVHLGQPVAIHTGRVGYVPTVELIALVLATPIPWSRRWRALLLGWGLVSLFVLFRVWLMLLFTYSQDLPMRLYSPGPFGSKVLSGCNEFFFISPTCSFLVPALVWAVVSLRREDIIRLLANPDVRPAKHDGAGADT